MALNSGCKQTNQILQTEILTADKNKERGARIHQSFILAQTNNSCFNNQENLGKKQIHTGSEYQNNY